DLVHEVAAVVPPLVITRLLGLPDDAAPPLLRHALAVIGYMDDPKAGLRGSRALRKLFAEAIEERRLRPGDDLISLLLAHEQLAAVRTAPALTAQAVDEVLRWEAPVQLTCRSAARDVVIGDIT